MVEGVRDDLEQAVLVDIGNRQRRGDADPVAVGPLARKAHRVEQTAVRAEREQASGSGASPIRAEHELRTPSVLLRGGLAFTSGCQALWGKWVWCRGWCAESMGDC